MEQASKQRKEIAQEDRLLQVLVPDIEQPFAIPENWKWCYLQFLSQIKTGKKDANYGSENGRYLFFTCAAEPIRCDYYSFEGKAILLAGNGDIGNISLYDGKFEAYQRTYVLTITEEISTEYLYFYFKYRWVDYNTDKTFGTAIPYIRLGNLQNFPVPLAPAAEQQRIVDRIESLFAKLDEAKEKAQAVVDGFEDRKAAILHKAFAGELTEKWRRTHKHLSKEWSPIPFEECIDTMQNGIAKRKGTEGEPFVVIRLANLSDDSFIEEDLREIVLDEKEQNNYELHQDDVIMIRVNGSKENVGKQYRVTNQKKWAFCDHLIRIHYTANVVSQYIVYYSKTKQYRQYIMDNMVSSAGQNTISRKGLSKLQLPIPSIEEQKEIVSLLDAHFEKENQAIGTAKNVINQIDTIKKSILARAFRGELGTNDPNDESAMELLKKVLSVETMPQPRKKGVTLPKEIAGELKTELERIIMKLFIQRETDSLPIKDLMSISSKPFDVLETLHDLEKRQIIKRAENNSTTYELMR